MKQVYIETLGCAKNTVYSEYMAGLLKDKGPYLLTNNPQTAHIIIVNTCGFISAAKEESINTLLQLADYKTHGQCQLLVAIGCMVQKYAEELKTEMPEIDLLIGTTSYDQLIKLLSDVVENDDISPIMVDHNWRIPDSAGYHRRRVSTPNHYAYLSIAEGCNNRCTYCAIPDMQGPYRSRPMADIIDEAAELVAQGYVELILIAQDTTYYGIDIYGKPMLSNLLKALCDIDKLKWIRLLYAYPDHFTDELIETMVNCDKICHYIDIPFQHVNDEILKQMNRHIKKDDILKLIDKLRLAMPDIMIRSTFITGFPGETEEQFEELMSFLHQVRLERVGAFPYSQEDKTFAGERSDQVPEFIRERRAEILMDFQYQIMHENHLEMIGKIKKVKAEEISEFDSRLLLCRSQGEAPDIDPFILVYDGNRQVGDFFDVRITGVDEYDLIGVSINESSQ